MDRTSQPVILCFSHLRWPFVFQRPQHLMSRFARDHQVYFVEEPVVHKGATGMVCTPQESGVNQVVINISDTFDPTQHDSIMRSFLDQLLVSEQIDRFIAWYYTPVFLRCSRHLQPVCTVYDCMDELSAFRGASPEIRTLEAELLQKADLVFTGGHSLYEAKAHLHSNIHPFPSSVDFDHFSKARSPLPQPADQASIPSPRLGFFGVVDERMDLDLLAACADANPRWHLVIVGPVVKIDQSTLPQRPNIHYLGMKSYQELPIYLSGWDLALMPFAQNEATRFISPTKTPEYLAGGKPVVSTPIRDVVRPYVEQGLVSAGSTPDEFIAAIKYSLSMNGSYASWLAKVDRSLSNISWDRTWRSMKALIQEVLECQTA